MGEPNDVLLGYTRAGQSGDCDSACVIGSDSHR